MIMFVSICVLTSLVAQSMGFLIGAGLSVETGVFIGPVASIHCMAHLCMALWKLLIDFSRSCLMTINTVVSHDAFHIQMLIDFNSYGFFIVLFKGQYTIGALLWIFRSIRHNSWLFKMANLCFIRALWL